MMGDRFRAAPRPAPDLSEAEMCELAELWLTFEEARAGHWTGRPVPGPPSPELLELLEPGDEPYDGAADGVSVYDGAADGVSVYR